MHYKNKLFVILTVVLIYSLLSGCCRSPTKPIPGSWTTGASMPTGRYATVSGVINGNIYVACGSESLKTVEIYNPQNDSWAIGPSIPTRRAIPSGGAINGQLYVAGADYVAGVGFTGRNRLEALNAVTTTWRSLSPLLVGVSGSTAAVANGCLYVFGGFGLTENSYKAVQKYDPLSDSWQMLAPIPINFRYWFNAESVGQNIYLLGGTYIGILIYHTDTNTWSQLTPPTPPEKKMGACTAVLNGKIYLIGGQILDGEELYVTNTVDVYDPATNNWSTYPPMPTERVGATAVSIEDRIYVIGGADQVGVSLRDVEVFHHK